MTIISPRPVGPGKSPARDIWPRQGVFYNILRPPYLRDKSLCVVVTGWDTAAHMKAAASSDCLQSSPGDFQRSQVSFWCSPLGCGCQSPLTFWGWCKAYLFLVVLNCKFLKTSCSFWQEKFVIMNLLHPRHFCCFQEAALVHSPLIKQFHDFVLKIFKSCGK